MKNLLFAWAAFLAATSVKAHHRCDDINTAAANAISSPLARAVQQALADKDAAMEAKLALDETLAGGLGTVQDSEQKKNAAAAALTIAEAKVELFSDQYAAASAAVAACQPTAEGSDCTLDMKNQLALQMVRKGQEMIDNDNEVQTQRNIFEQMTFEYNQAKSANQFDQASYNSKATRVIEDLNTAAATYQNLKDQFDKHQVTDIEAQKECMLEQYHDDMAEIERLTALLSKCQTQGCNQADLDASELIGLTFDQAQEITPTVIGPTILPGAPLSFHEDGNIRFPNCGPYIQSSCFWQHYQSYGWLDFLSVIMWPLSIIGCALMPRYEYNLCMANFAYILVDDAARTVAPYIAPL